MTTMLQMRPKKWDKNSCCKSRQGASWDDDARLKLLHPTGEGDKDKKPKEEKRKYPKKSRTMTTMMVYFNYKRLLLL